MWAVTELRLGGYGLPFLQTQSRVFGSCTKTDWQTIGRRRRPRASCHPLAIHINFFYADEQASVPRWDKCSNVNGDCVEVWCIPSATRLPSRHYSQSNVLGIRLFTFLLKLFRTWFWNHDHFLPQISNSNELFNNNPPFWQCKVRMPVSLNKPQITKFTNKRYFSLLCSINEICAAQAVNCYNCYSW